MASPMVVAPAASVAAVMPMAPVFDEQPPAQPNPNPAGSPDTPTNPQTSNRQEKEPNGSASKKRDVTVTWNGVPNGLLPKLKLIAATEQDKATLPTATAVRRAAAADIKKIDNALKAAGYFAGSADYRLDRAPDGALTLAFDVTPGPAFQITEHQIVYTDTGAADDTKRPQTFSDAGVKVTTAADGATLQANHRALLDALWSQGYPAARMVARRAIADIDAGTARAVYEMESGPRATFGEVSLNGLTRTRSDYIRKLITWSPGDLYDKSKTVDFRDRLSGTNLFSSIEVTPAATQDDGTTPVIANLEERKHRTIGAGAGYSTTDGPSVRVFFENRNLFKRGELFRIDLLASQIEQSATFNFDKPLVSLPGAAFAQGRFANQTNSAFDARTVELSGGLAKFWLDRRLETRAGLAFDTSRIEPKNGDPEERTFFVSLPLSATWNNEDDLLNPTEGARATLRVIPYTGTETFVQTELNARTRVAFGSRKKFVTAFRVRAGTTFDTSASDLPINKRFFAGGGGSVRGFGFQEAGPVQVDERIDEDSMETIVVATPTGGTSVLEGGIELRYKVTDAIQAAAFMDVGYIDNDDLPRATEPPFDEDLYIGVGGGVRYFTPVGPIRVDIGIPLNRRPTENPVQLIISLGQAF